MDSRDSVLKASEIFDGSEVGLTLHPEPSMANLSGSRWSRNCSKAISWILKRYIYKMALYCNLGTCSNHAPRDCREFFAPALLADLLRT